MVKIDRNSKIIWATPGKFHHSLELAYDGTLIACLSLPPFQKGFPFRGDQAYAVINQNGQEIQRFSISKILLDNGYRKLLLTKRKYPGDLHLNEARPINRDIGIARRGDVALSVLRLSAVFLYRPSTNKIIWLKKGPWIRQHDVDLLDDRRYSIFRNDRGPHGFSNICIYDPVTGQIETPFTEIFTKEKICTEVQGRSRILPNGDAFIEETTSSRILRGSTKKVRWEYVDGATKNTAGSLHWSRYLTADEFKAIGEDLWG